MTTNQTIDGVPRDLRPVLAMILNALDRDAADGKAVRGEMAAELRALLDSDRRPEGCCCPPKGYPGLWAAAMCPVHQGLRSLKLGTQPAPVAVKHTMRSIMEAVECSSEFTVLTSNQCAALAAALNAKE